MPVTNIIKIYIMQIVLDTRGLGFSVRNKCFLIESETKSRIIHPSKVSSILITAPCRISSPALILAAQSEVPVIICNNCGEPEVRIWSSRFINISTLRRKQYMFTTHNQAINWALGIILEKISGQILNMSLIADRKPSINEEVQKAKKEILALRTIYENKFNSERKILKKDIVFLEAYTANRYWQIIGLKLPPPFTFKNRIKRQPPDLFNNSINYLYGMLRNTVESAILSIGLDPSLGIIHRDGYKMPSLVFDLMEPFRPIADRILITAILNNKMPENIDEKNKEELQLSKQGRKTLIALFNENLDARIKYRGIVTTLQNHILTEAKLLSDQIKQL